MLLANALTTREGSRPSRWKAPAAKTRWGLVLLLYMVAGATAGVTITSDVRRGSEVTRVTPTTRRPLVSMNPENTIGLDVPKGSETSIGPETSRGPDATKSPDPTRSPDATKGSDALRGPEATRGTNTSREPNESRTPQVTEVREAPETRRTEPISQTEVTKESGAVRGSKSAMGVIEKKNSDTSKILLKITRMRSDTAIPRFALGSIIRLPSIWSFIKMPAILKPFTGKSSFLTGFGLGVLTVALKKLLLPFLIGGQILKSVLIAMFLPSILGGLGKVLGKGVSSFAAASGGSGGLSGPLSGLGGGGGGADGYGDFREPDGGAYGDADAAGSDPSAFAYADAPHYGNNGVSRPANAPLGSLGLDPSNAQSKVGHHEPLTGYYERRKQPNFGAFQQMPSSPLLLASFDPFYSPLLSRLDAVFAALGPAGEGEACRRRLVCAMYAAPARYAPYSSLVSAQLSRELNELRKPSSDNPEILRFFRYMKAAKDGQDGQDCAAMYTGCPEFMTSAEEAGVGSNAPPMLQTFHDIDKLVHARMFLW